MGFWDALTQAALGTTNVVARAQRKAGYGPRKARKPECTPCAASAYVEGLRGEVSSPKKRPKKR